MSVQIIKYRVDTWGNKNSGEKMYGVSVRIVGHPKWVHVAEGGKAVLFYDRVLATDYIAHMKFERDKDGFKIAKPVAPLPNPFEAAA